MRIFPSPKNSIMRGPGVDKKLNMYDFGTLVTLSNQNEKQKNCNERGITFQSYIIKSAPWTILWFRILGIFSVEYIKRLCVFMFKSCSNSQLLRRVLWISAEQPIGASLKHKNTQPLYMFNRVRVLHLNRLKERTWLHSFGLVRAEVLSRLKLRAELLSLVLLSRIKGCVILTRQCCD